MLYFTNVINKTRKSPKINIWERWFLNISDVKLLCACHQTTSQIQWRGYNIQLLSAASIVIGIGEVEDKVSPKKHSKEAGILEATIFWGYRLNIEAQNSTCDLE